jgi:hypothetical protein
MLLPFLWMFKVDSALLARPQAAAQLSRASTRRYQSVLTFDSVPADVLNSFRSLPSPRSASSPAA